MCSCSHHPATPLPWGGGGTGPGQGRRRGSLGLGGAHIRSVPTGDQAPLIPFCSCVAYVTTEACRHGGATFHGQGSGDRAVGGANTRLWNVQGRGRQGVGPIQGNGWGQFRAVAGASTGMWVGPRWCQMGGGYHLSWAGWRWAGPRSGSAALQHHSDLISIISSVFAMEILWLLHRLTISKICKTNVGKISEDKAGDEAMGESGTRSSPGLLGQAGGRKRGSRDLSETPGAATVLDLLTALSLRT